MLDVWALYAILSKLTLTLKGGNWGIVCGTCSYMYMCALFCGCQVCREVSEGDRELGEGAKDNGRVRKSEEEV